jgi:hypothetical protein
MTTQLTVRLPILDLAPPSMMVGLTAWMMLSEGFMPSIPYLSATVFSILYFMATLKRRQFAAINRMLFEELLDVGIAIEIGDPETIAREWLRTSVAKHMKIYGGRNGDKETHTKV